MPCPQLVLAALLAVAAARPQEPIYDPSEDLRAAGIVRMESVQNDDGSFSYGYETAGEGQESAQDVAGGPQQIGDEVGIASQGTFSFVAKDEYGNDVPIAITWRAGPDGVVMEGDAIPVDTNKAAQDAAYAAAALV